MTAFKSVQNELWRGGPSHLACLFLCGNCIAAQPSGIADSVTPSPGHSAAVSQFLSRFESQLLEYGLSKEQSTDVVEVLGDKSAPLKLEALSSLNTDVNGILVWAIQNNCHVKLDFTSVKLVIEVKRIRQMEIWCE